MPKLIMLCGLPGSGKTTIANRLIQFASENGEIIVSHSSDALRKELYGDENIQDKNQELFVELHRRIKRDLNAGLSVIYDATNIDKKRRTAFLNELKNIDCCKKCFCIMTRYEDCVHFNSNRSRKVPTDVIKKMYLNWCPPDYSEGFDEIHFVFPFRVMNEFYLRDLFEGENGIDFFDQENSHHALTLGEHCRKASVYTMKEWSDKPLLHTAALLHDIGKVFTKTKNNSCGEFDGDYHYYQHDHVSAYLAIFYMKNMGLKVKDMVYISNLIFYHMRPYIAWKQSEKALKRDIAIIGEEMYEDILRLHEADLSAH